MIAGGLIKARFHFNSLRAIDFDRFFHCLNCIQFKHVAHTCTRHASFNAMSSGLVWVCVLALLLKRQEDCVGKAFDMPFGSSHREENFFPKPKKFNLKFLRQTEFDFKTVIFLSNFDFTEISNAPVFLCFSVQTLNAFGLI